MKSAKFSRLTSSVSVIVAVFAIALGAVLPSHAASPSSSGRTGLPAQDNAASFLKGTWVGKAVAYYNGKSKGRNEQKFVITEVRGFSAKGTHQYRSLGSKSWSPAESINFTALFKDSAGLWQVYGVQEVQGGDAHYFGSTTQDGGLYLVALDPQPLTDIVSVAMTLKKRR
jgi:hypothetical protein